MKKPVLVLSVLTAILLFSSIGLAAPVTDFQAWQFNLGLGILSYDDMDFWATGDDSTEVGNFYLQLGLTDNLAVGIDSFHFGSLTEYGGYYGDPVTTTKNYTDIKGIVKIIPNLQLFGGARVYSTEYYNSYYGYGINESETDPLFGAGITVPLGDSAHLFASWQKADIIKDTQAGLMFQSDYFGIYATLNRLDVNGSKYDGAGLGLNFQF